MKTRILHIVTSMNLGGIQTLLMTLYRNIDRENIQFDFVCHVKEECAFNKEIISLGGKIYYIPKYSFLSSLTYYKSWCLFFNSHPEYSLIHGHVRSSAIFYLLAAKRKKIKTIVHSHSQYKSSTLIGIMKEFLQYPIKFLADYTIACSEEAALYLFGRNKSRGTYILGNFIDVNRFLFNNEERIAARKSLNIEDQIVIGTVGRIVKEKNPDFIIDIVQELVNQEFEFKFLWIGDGYMMDYVKNRITQMQLKDYFILQGSKKNVEYYLQAMDIFILCSISEGFGISAIESQASGLPTLLSDKVPSEVAITPQAKMITIDNGVRPWVEDLLKTSMCENRREYTSIVIDSNYNVNFACKELTEFYKHILNS